MKNKLSMICLMVIPVLSHSMDNMMERAGGKSLKERLAELNASMKKSAAGVTSAVQEVGSIQNPTGYVDSMGAVKLDFARQQLIDSVRKALENIEASNGLDTARDAVGHILRYRSLEPRQELKPHVRYLLDVLRNISLEEQEVLLSVLANGLALKAAARVQD